MPPTAVYRDQDDLVTLEAVKALFGQLPPYNPSVMTGATAQTPQEELVSNRMRIRAWSMVASQVLLLLVSFLSRYCQPPTSLMHTLVTGCTQFFKC